MTSYLLQLMMDFNQTDIGNEREANALNTVVSPAGEGDPTRLPGDNLTNCNNCDWQHLLLSGPCYFTGW